MLPLFSPTISSICDFKLLISLSCDLNTDKTISPALFTLMPLFTLSNISIPNSLSRASSLLFKADGVIENSVAAFLIEPVLAIATIYSYINKFFIKN